MTIQLRARKVIRSFFSSYGFELKCCHEVPVILLSVYMCPKMMRFETGA